MAIATTNPTTGTVEQEFTAHDLGEVERRLSLGESAARKLRGTNYEQRAGWSRAAAAILEDEVEDLARMVTIEMGKPIAQSRSEVLKCAKTLRFYAEKAEGFLADKPLDDPSTVGAGEAWSCYEPLGVVLAVMPWNYPLWQVMRFAAPALMAGNAGLLKHASNVPQSALYLDSLFSRAGFPEGAFQVVLVGSGPVADIIADPRVKAITLTGSEPAGRSVAAAAGKSIKKAVLELGGSDPFIVMPSADLEQAVAIAVIARMNNNGQSCIAGKRFIVHTDVYEEFTRQFVKTIAGLVVGDPLDESTQVGPLATRAGRDELAELVDDAVANGAVALTGGTRTEREGWFYPPTVLENVTPKARLFLEEAFGPVAVVYRVNDLDEAVALSNATTFGLSSAIWTAEVDEQKHAISHLDAGAVFVNGMTISYPELAFGGIKDSGYGRELASAGIKEFCNLKSVWIA